MEKRDLVRRSFLKSIGAGAAIGAVTIADAPAQGPPAVGKKRFRIGFIGVGVRGQRNLAAALSREDLEVVALCDVYKPNLDAALKLAPAAKVYADFRDLIAAKDIDAVCVSTPDHWHAYMTIEACKAGKDVYVEKPVSVTVQEGRMMVKAARKYDRVVEVGTQQRSGPHYQRAVEIVRSGKLGKISFVRTFNYSNTSPEGIGNPPDSEPPAGLDWEMWLGPAPYHPFNPNRFGVNPDTFSHFRWFWDYAGGMMTDLGVHSLDIVLWALKVLGPSAVCMLGGKYVVTDNREAPDTLVATFEFPEFLCTYEYRDGNAPSQGRALSEERTGITFHGTEGTLFIDRGRWELIPQKKFVGGSSGLFRQSREVTDRIPGEMGVASNPDQTDAHWADFVRCLRTRRRPISDIEEGHRSTTIALLGNISYRSRQRLDWDPKTETTTNKEAQTYLRREYRKPWELTL